jgi:hypothetical protein
MFNYDQQSPPETAEFIEWTDPRLARVYRLRLLSDRGVPHWCVSYCWGLLKDGTKVRITLPFETLPKGRTMKAAIIKAANMDRVFAKRLMLLENTTYSFLQ